MSADVRDAINTARKFGAGYMTESQLEVLADAAERCAALERENERIHEAMLLYRQASLQGHAAHWDATGQHGASCPECDRVRTLRGDADRIVASLEPTDG